MSGCKCEGKGYRILYFKIRLSEKVEGYGEHPLTIRPYLTFCECPKGAEVEELHKLGEISIDLE
jgi:hypothetical protein